jgi:phage shock protein PspC (stress-responsive transcriptional regulator)
MVGHAVRMTSDPTPPPFEEPSLPPPSQLPSSEPAARPPLHRSSTDRMLGGVCGGLAEHTGIDSLIWRVGFVGLTVAGGAGIVVYLLLWVLMPPGSRGPNPQLGPVDRMAEQLHGKISNSRLMPPHD